MIYNILDEDDFYRIAQITRRIIRREFGVTLKISHVMLDDAYRAWHPITRANIEDPHRGLVGEDGHVIDPDGLLKVMRQQIGLLCCLMAGQPRLLRVERAPKKDAQLVRFSEGLTNYPQEMFAIMVCVPILRRATFALKQREFEITSQALARLIQLAKRATTKVSELRNLADVVDPLSS
ncbi:hypothetical protein C7I87_20950 [Mesorhizobium sp. SARCC-RB16n]|uniref:hypothetical protein n=1 Tax=Mesorhizobium sp. SARCC-RB16n TaxID=2116687 RepID=UPI00122F5E8C|nr:hypothetical protein [Mesorhizobium sp. SARCC-RB16n]KAA3448621.1 hypothetical protein C7I87_20950 [Mesorhizobium sp. SARCC-RB16n]